MIKYLVVHCSASPQGRGDNAETIHRWHRERGWDGIGYHRVILENGNTEHGRPCYWNGAHVRGHNHESIGVCLIGEGGDATEQQLDSLRMVIGDLLDEHPSATVVGHCDLDSNKPNCPGFNVGDWWVSAGGAVQPERLATLA